MRGVGARACATALYGRGPCRAQRARRCPGAWGLGSFAIPGFLESRYGRQAKLIYVVTLVVFGLGLSSIILYSGSLVALQLFGLDNDIIFYCALGLATGIYAVTGGLSSVVYTARPVAGAAGPWRAGALPGPRGRRGTERPSRIRAAAAPGEHVARRPRSDAGPSSASREANSMTIELLEGGLHKVPQPVADHHCYNGCGYAKRPFADSLRSISEAGRIDTGNAFFRKLQAVVGAQVASLHQIADRLLSRRPAANRIGESPYGQPGSGIRALQDSQLEVVHCLSVGVPISARGSHSD